MKSSNVTCVSEILLFSETLGYDWNTAQEILDKGYVIPDRSESHIREYNIETLHEFVNPQSISYEIIKRFMEKNKIDNITILF